MRSSFFTYLIPFFLTISSGTLADVTGKTTREALEAEKFKWMVDGVSTSKAEFSKKKKTIDALKKDLKAVDVEVYFGSWCGDSHDHVPTFLALMDLTHPKGISLVALDRKRSFPGYSDSRKIERLPTFIFLNDGKEIGRIIETPKVSILEDTVEILKKNTKKEL